MNISDGLPWLVEGLKDSVARFIVTSRKFTSILFASAPGIFKPLACMILSIFCKASWVCLLVSLLVASPSSL